MNPHLKFLQPYPFEKLKQLKQGISSECQHEHIALSIGEPKHSAPDFIEQTLSERTPVGLGLYPSTKGLPELRQAIADWLRQRFQISNVDPENQVLPVNGTREALFSFAQCLIDPRQNEKPVIIMPNPFYQIYEGAAILAGAEPYFLNTTEQNQYCPDFDSVPENIWRRCQLIYICSPGNPSGAVLSYQQHEKLLSLAEQYDFVIASDECYTEIYDDETQPPQGLLQSAYQMGNSAFKRCVVFQSLSKRSNLPGLRSGFVAGDADLLQAYFQYRTYHGCAMSVHNQQASIAAWRDEQHVVENRRLYREKFNDFIEVLAPVCEISKPPASFYIWLKTPIDDTLFARQLFAQQNITVLPGSYLSRTAEGVNPGQNHVRIALVAALSETRQAAERIKTFIHSLN